MNKKVKNWALLFATFVAIGCSLPAQETSLSSSNAASWTFTASTLSQYAFRGVRRGDLCLQPSLEYDTGKLGLGVWANVPLKDKVAGQPDSEFDFYGYYAVELSNSISVVPGFTAYTYPDAKRSNGFYSATFEPNIALNYAVGGIRLTPKLYYDFVLKGPTAELMASFAVPLKDWGTELDFSATAGTYLWKDAVVDGNPAVKNWGDYYLAGVSLPYQVSKDSKVLIGWAYTTGSKNFLKQGIAGKTTNAATIGCGIATMSYSVTF
ncbi:MAG TPA: TorF family putative porin [Lacunisphaera sp.]